MKSTLRYLMLGLMITVLIAGCSKQPVQEINAAKASVDAAVAEGAEKYAPADAKKVNDALSAAMNEIKTQDGKFIKDYKKAKEMLTKVKSDAEALKSGLAAKKDDANKNAVFAGESAGAAINEIKSLLKKMPRAKGESDNRETAVKELDESLKEVKKLVAAEDYIEAIEKADLIKNKAAGLIIEMRKAIEKKPAKAVIMKKTARKK